MKPLIKISGYTSMWSEKQQRTVPGAKPYDTDFYTEMERIRDGYYQPIIQQLRSITDDKESKKFKAEKLPAISISAVTHTWRKIENVVNHTGLLNIDIDGEGNDHITDWPALRDKIFELPTILSCFLSARGSGVTFVVKVSPEVHTDTFLSICKELKDHMDIHADTVVKDIVRLRFVSYDAGCKIRYNFDDITQVRPSKAYLIEKAALKDALTNAYPVSNADSIQNFKNAIAHAEAQNKMSFQDGEKHKYLVSVAGYCNCSGMTEQFCNKMTIKFFANKTNIDTKDLLQPVANAYKRYSSQHGTMRLVSREPANKSQLRFLLRHVKKFLLKETWEKFGKPHIIGESKYTVKVDTPLLVYLMWLIAPEYTWTTWDVYDKYFTVLECKDLIPKDCILDSANGSRVWVNKFNEYPTNW